MNHIVKKNLFEGELVRLTSETPETIGKHFSRWMRDSEYSRLLDSDYSSMRSDKKIKEFVEKELEEGVLGDFFFEIRVLENDHLVGFIGLNDIQWNHGDCWIGIGIGDRDYWGKGYGTDAMRVVLRYAFDELNLYRVTLGVFAYNPRAIRSYEKAGFRMEGVERSAVQRDGSRADIYIMGLLREEWEALYNDKRNRR